MTVVHWFQPVPPSKTHVRVGEIVKTYSKALRVHDYTIYRVDKTAYSILVRQSEEKFLNIPIALETERANEGLQVREGKIYSWTHMMEACALKEEKSGECPILAAIVRKELDPSTRSPGSATIGVKPL